MHWIRVPSTTPLDRIVFACINSISRFEMLCTLPVPEAGRPHSLHVQCVPVAAFTHTRNVSAASWQRRGQPQSNGTTCKMLTLQFSNSEIEFMQAKMMRSNGDGDGTLIQGWARILYGCHIANYATALCECEPNARQTRKCWTGSVHRPCAPRCRTDGRVANTGSGR